MTAVRNLITDVPGVRVGHAEDEKLGSGATVVLFDQPAVAAADLRGGGPGTRESALLDPAMTVERIDAIACRGVGLRTRRRFRCAGLAARARTRVCRAFGARADRAGGDPV
jgi:L-aminopeptidase/D-esterase-like protein